MSRENLEAVRQVCAHWERGEWAAGGELIDPDVEVVFSTTSALNRLHGRGKESGALVDAESGSSSKSTVE
jgi:ketosteroid isomerase-like protein